MEVSCVDELIMFIIKRNQLVVRKVASEVI